MQEGSALSLSIKWLPWLVGLVGLGATIALFLFLRSSEQQAAESQFRQDATERILTVRSNIGASMQPVSFLASFYTASPEVSRSQFRTFTAESIEDEPNGAERTAGGVIQALEWIPRITLEERLAHEASAAADGFVGYEIRERSVDGDLVRAADREEYYPVSFVEPLEGNEAALGFDLASNPSRLAALERARDSGELTLTERIKLVQETGEQAGFLAFIPIYGGVAPPATVAERRARLEGFVLGVYRVGNIVTAALADLNAVDIDVYLLDESAALERRLLYPGTFGSIEEADAGLRAAVFNQEPEGFSESSNLTLGGREWRLLVVPGAGYIDAQLTPFPLGVLAAGIVFSGLVTAYLVVLSGRRIQIEKMVTEKTAELTRTNDNLAHEVSERVRWEEAVQQRAEELARSNAELEAFTYSVSHDLKEPLRSLEAFSQFLAEDYADQLDEQGKEYIGRLGKASVHMKTLIEDLLELSRVSREIKAATEVDTEAAVRVTIERLEAAIKETPGATITVAEGLSDVFADRTRIEQVFSNLISNAVKFSNGGPATITIGQRDLKNDYATFFVQDNGIGIDPQYHERVFGIFQRLNRREEYAGTGAGLSIVKRVVESYGGSVWIESDLGAGAKFLFTLPVSSKDGQTATAEAA